MDVVRGQERAASLYASRVLPNMLDFRSVPVLAADGIRPEKESTTRSAVIPASGVKATAAARLDVFVVAMRQEI